MLALIILLFVVLLLKINQYHLKIDFFSFFKRGFTSISNLFGVFAFCGKQGSRQDLFSVLKWLSD